jgi:hypothetical protein
MSDFTCSDCGKEYKSKSGLWKHQQKCLNTDDEEIASLEKNGGDGLNHTEDDAHLSSSPSDSSTDGDSPTSDSVWNTWGETEYEPTTESLPPQLKLLKGGTGRKSGKKMTAKEQKALDDKTVALLEMGLSMADAGISLYGQKALLDEDYQCKHSQSEKRMVATAQMEALKEKGIELTNVLTPTTVAVALTGAYLVPPIYKINKKSKKSIVKNGGRRLLSYIPIFGRRFRKKKETQGLQDFPSEYMEGLE